MSETGSARRIGASGVKGLQLLRCGEFILDNETMEFVAPGGRKIRCTKLEHRIMASLMMNRGRPVSIERLMLQVYGTDTHDHPDITTLRVAFSNIRRKLKTESIEPDIIKNVTNVGYHLVCGKDEIEVLVLDRPRMAALDAVLAAAQTSCPHEVALLRRAA